MDSKNTNRLKEQLNKISFRNMENVFIGDVLHYCLNVKTNTKLGVRSVIKMIIFACSYSYDFEVSGNPKTVALFSNSYRGRRDHKKAFDAVTELLNDYVKLSCGKYRINITGIMQLKNLFWWNRQMKKAVPGFWDRMFFLNIIFRAYMDYSYFERLCKKYSWQIDNLVSYSDAHPIDSYFTQMFNLKQKNTVTLQHGFFNKKTDSWAYLGSKSKWFLADSAATVEDAKSIGYQGNMLVVGSPHYLGQKEYFIPEAFKADTIGVVMNTSIYPVEDNVGMILTVQEYCRKNQKKMVLKYHPANNPEDYAKYIDAEIVTTYGKEISIEQFGNMIDVAVVSASTVFTAMLKQWVPVFLFVREGYDPELFSGVSCLKFTDSSEFSKLINWTKENEFKEEFRTLREYFLASGDFESNYKKVFSDIGVL